MNRSAAFLCNLVYNLLEAYDACFSAPAEERALKSTVTAIDDLNAHIEGTIAANSFAYLTIPDTERRRLLKNLQAAAVYLKRWVGFTLQPPTFNFVHIDRTQTGELLQKLKQPAQQLLTRLERCLEVPAPKPAILNAGDHTVCVMLKYDAVLLHGYSREGLFVEVRGAIPDAASWKSSFGFRTAENGTLFRMLDNLDGLRALINYFQQSRAQLGLTYYVGSTSAKPTYQRTNLKVRLTSDMYRARSVSWTTLVTSKAQSTPAQQRGKELGVAISRNGEQWQVHIPLLRLQPEWRTPLEETLRELRMENWEPLMRYSNAESGCRLIPLWPKVLMDEGIRVRLDGWLPLSAA